MPWSCELCGCERGLLGCSNPFCETDAKEAKEYVFKECGIKENDLILKSFMKIAKKIKELKK